MQGGFQDTEIIAIAVPNQYHVQRAESALQREVTSGALLIETVSPHNVREKYQALKAAHVGAILARGGTYSEFSQLKGDIPLVEMRISTLDILEALRNAERSGAERVHLLLFEQIRYDADFCLQFIHTTVIYTPFRDVDDLQEKIKSIPFSEKAVIVGSGFVSELSKGQTFPLPFQDILLNDETLRTYYAQAKTLLRQMRQERESLSQLQTVLAHIEEGVIVIDSAGNILNSNRLGTALLGQEHPALNGLSILSLLPDFPFTRLLGQDVPEPRSKLLRVNAVDLNLSIVSYQAYRSERQYLLTVQAVHDIQKREQNIRFKLADRGLTAQHTFEDIYTQVPEMKQLIGQAVRVSDAPGPVLLVGESGTGKELFAQSIHNQSSRKNGPFVAVNCAALNESLLESELFGYAGGAFTGARKDGKAGLFELAHQGTIFLDEINSMPASLQSKILRVLEDRKVMRLGSDYIIPLDIRLISAANQDLMEQVRAGNFRLDLYYRLNTFTLRIPPLRQRSADVLPLFYRYVEQFRREQSPAQTIPDDFLKLLQEHDWPGNVRELRNVALRYAAFGGDNSLGEILCREPVPEGSPLLAAKSGCIDLRELSRTVEQLVIQSLLDSGMGKADAARLLGISRQALYQKMRRSGPGEGPPASGG